jgi:flagellar biosynthesis protein FlhA
VHVLDYLVPATILLAVLVVLAPVPAPVVDLLLAANLTVSVLALLGALAARTPLEMSVFPTFLLGATLVRLVLNISTTRLILSRAAIDGTGAAGEVVEAFGQFVSANNIVVGGVIFAIIAIVQFIVITAGATRTSEVAARFTLDGLPGRQMAIDSEVSAGTITREQARGLRLELQRQADFFASMDGASRFVRGEAVASVIITLVNLIGGLAIGMLQHGMALPKAVDVYSRLTIGDGLVGAVPSLFVAVATGLLISRSTQAVDLSQELGRQFVARPHVLLITAAFLGVLSLTGMPFVPLAGMAVLTLVGAYLLARSGRGTAAASAAPQEPTRSNEKLADVLTDDRIVVELGRGLLGLVSGAGAPLLEKAQALRSAVAADLGVVVPAIAFKDDLAHVCSSEEALFAFRDGVDLDASFDGASVNTYSFTVVGQHNTDNERFYVANDCDGWTSTSQASSERILDENVNNDRRANLGFQPVRTWIDAHMTLFAGRQIPSWRLRPNIDGCIEVKLACCA